MLGTHIWAGASPGRDIAPGSQNRNLTRSARLARNTRIVPENGSCASVSLASAASPSMPLRKSTGRLATSTRRPPGGTITAPRSFVAGTGIRPAGGPRNNPAGTWSMLWVRQFAFPVVPIAHTMSDSPHHGGPSEGPPLSGTPDGLLAPTARPHALAEQGTVTVAAAGVPCVWPRANRIIGSAADNCRNARRASYSPISAPPNAILALRVTRAR